MEDKVYTLLDLAEEFGKDKQFIRRRISRLKLRAINKDSREHINEPLEYDHQAFLKLSEELGVSKFKKDKANETRDDTRSDTHETRDDTRSDTHETRDDTHKTRDDTRSDTYETRDDTHETRDDTYETRDDTHETRDDTHETRDDTHETRDDTHETRDDTQKLSDDINKDKVIEVLERELEHSKDKLRKSEEEKETLMRLLDQQQRLSLQANQKIEILESKDQEIKEEIKDDKKRKWWQFFK